MLFRSTIGLIVAIATGIGELVFVLVKEKRIDRFIIFDTGLLLALGAVSLVFNNDIFFKLKPAFINLILCAVLGLSAFSDKNLLMLYTQRYLKDITMGPGQQAAMQKTVRAMFWMMSAYTLLIIYSAFFMSKEAWGFISGALLYILFAVYFGWQFLSNRRKSKDQSNEEWVPLVDDSGNITGKAPRSLVHRNPGMLHPVVHLHVLNSKGEIYLQKRSMNKDLLPGKWDTAVGGHIGLGETVEQALQRETNEEIGLKDFKAQPLARYRWDSGVESELVFSFITLYNATLYPDKQEIEEGKFWKVNEIEAMLGKGILTPNFEKEFPMLRELLYGKRN